MLRRIWLLTLLAFVASMLLALNSDLARPQALAQAARSTPDTAVNGQQQVSREYAARRDTLLQQPAGRAPASAALLGSKEAITKPAVAVLVGLKYVLPALLVPFPFVAGWANFVLDSVDGDLLIPLGLPDPAYQQIDKSADWVTYLFMAVAAWRWPIRRTVIALFAFRSIGQALFFLTGNEIVFFLFPNFLEPLFLVFASIALFKRAEAGAFYRRHLLAVWTGVVLYKMPGEWVTHVGNIDRTDVIRQIFS